MNFITALQKYRDLILPVAIIACIGVILVPLPTTIMDLLLSANITISVIVLLTTIYIRTPLEFNVFPSLLVATTLGRLVLNIATTRLILTGAEKSSSPAGGVIEAFGQFVAGDKIEIGIIIFVIIVLIQFLVITKGATRVSEVAARFALDGMPGRQMSIDADLSSGAIDEAEAKKRRTELTTQADFYGAMDGASKFVRGDAIAGILITLINIAGGLYVGMTYVGQTPGEAFEMFTRLTIGDGLVSQVPAFLISLAAAILVTRSTQRTNLPTEFLSQLLSRPQALFVAAGFLGLLIFTQLPTVPLLALGSGCCGLAFVISRQTKAQEQAEEKAKQDAEVESQRQAQPTPEKFLNVDPMRLEIGGDLLVLADQTRGGDLLSRISNVRTLIASEMGFLLPSVRLMDRLNLPPTVYEIQIAGNAIARGEVFPDRLLAIEIPGLRGKVEGFETQEPAAGRPAVWISSDKKQMADYYGYQIAEPSQVMATHLQEIARKHADELLTREGAKSIIDQLKEFSPTVVDELIPSVLKLSEVQTVLQLLLQEDVPIRQLEVILEALGDFAPKTKEPVLLVEYVRKRLSRTISQRFSDEHGQLHVITMKPEMEARIAQAAKGIAAGSAELDMSPEVAQFTVNQIAKQLKLLKDAGHIPVLLVSPAIRPAVRQLTRRDLPELRIMAHSEISTQTNAISVGLVSDEVENT
ncbi:MAG TPA: flagellar biosynthesis protein FlhA [Planctomycetaceae bacterium]|nr:flagellar biosynthesis protein FlhA [Planctomycetaceae bacterium]